MRNFCGVLFAFWLAVGVALQAQQADRSSGINRDEGAPTYHPEIFRRISGTPAGVSVLLDLKTVHTGMEWLLERRTAQTGMSVLLEQAKAAQIGIGEPARQKTGTGAAGPLQEHKTAPAGMSGAQWHPATAMKKMANGLVVVVSEDHSAPTVGVCVSYGIGFRLEPEGRTGFAHLFEHMMFEGTPVAPKGVFDRVIEGGGGFNNGDTRYDFTEYIESAPISALDPILWLEADRMKTLDFSPKNLENQRNVVEEEVRVNVLNQPYGLFFAIDLPGKAFDTYPNAHNFYGDFKDLDAANIGDVQKFYEQYYAPNNAVLAIVGDVHPDETFAKVEKYFAAIPARQTPPRPNVNEPPQTAERRAEETDKLAQVPALAIGYRMPAHGSHDSLVAAVAGELLHNGEASLLYQALVKEKQVALSVSGGSNWPLGNPFEYNGPTLMTSFITYPPGKNENEVVGAFDVVVADLAKKGPSPAALERIIAKMRSDWYEQLEIPISRASVLSHAVLFDGKFDRVYSIPDEIATVTGNDVKTFAAKYLIQTNRTMINRVPGPGSKKEGGAQ